MPSIDGAQGGNAAYFTSLDLGCRLFQGPLEFLVLFLGQDLEELPVLFNSDENHLGRALLGEHVGFALLGHLADETSEVRPRRKGIDKFWRFGFFNGH